jgi:drug/metabolite transporter (DMT)-like permease
MCRAASEATGRSSATRSCAPSPSFLIFASGLLFAMQGATVKYVVPTGVGALEAIFVRGLIQLIGSAGFLALGRRRPDAFAVAWQLKWWLLLRGVIGYGGIFGGFMALELISLGDAAALGFVAPCISSVVAWLALGERMAAREMVGVVGAACGIVLIARPPALFGALAEPISVSGILLALLGASCAGFVIVLLRKLAQQIDWPIVLLAQAIGQVALSYPCAVLLDRPWVAPRWPDVWLVMIIGGLCALAGQVAVTMGLKGTRVGPASALRTSNVLMSFALQLIVTPDEKPHPLSIAGAAVVAGSCVLVAVAKTKKAAPALAAADGTAKRAEELGGGMPFDPAGLALVEQRGGQPGREAEAVSVGVENGAGGGWSDRWSETGEGAAEQGGATGKGRHGGPEKEELRGRGSGGRASLGDEDTRV